MMRLTNTVEIAAGSIPFNANTVGDGISVSWKGSYRLDPLHPIAIQDPGGDHLTGLQEFQAGTYLRNPDVPPPSASCPSCP